MLMPAFNTQVRLLGLCHSHALCRAFYDQAPAVEIRKYDPQASLGFLPVYARLLYRVGPPHAALVLCKGLIC